MYNLTLKYFRLITRSITLLKVISKHEKVRVDLLTRLNDLTTNHNELLKVKQESVEGNAEIIF